MYHSWSLDIDMQFYLISPLLLVPFYYHKLAGVVTCLAVILVQSVCAGLLTHWHQLTITCNLFPINYMVIYYSSPLTRMSPFIVGVLAGSWMTTHGDRMQLSRVTVLCVWLLSAVTMLTIIFGFHDYHTYQAAGGDLACVLYNSLARLAWAVCVAWVILACSWGYGGPVNSFLSWPPLVVLGRVTYMGYLINMYVLEVILGNWQRSQYLSFFNLTMFCIIELVVTCLAAAIFTVCIEFPLLSLEQNWTARKRRVKIA